MERMRALPLSWTILLMILTCVLCDESRSLRSMRL
uniref:Uncharacterized protein n=1 Tax=Arundo donax TaxID=35708 RepID=A0A0A9B0Y8_ARUDO